MQKMVARALVIFSLVLLLFPLRVAWGIEILSPKNGAVFNPGDRVLVEAKPSNGEVLRFIMFYAGLHFSYDLKKTDSFDFLSPYTWEFTLPKEHVGPVKIVAGGRPVNDSDKVKNNASVTITVALPSTTTLQKIDAAVGGQKSTVLSVYANPHGERIDESSTEYLSTSGFYSDGVERYLAADPSNIYTSSNKKVAIVEAGKGKNPALVTAVGPGDATITVQNGSHRDSVKVTVIEERCPAEAIKPDGTLNIFKCR